MMKLDFYDKRILFELDKNARATSKSIGKTLKKSKQFVDYRIKKLEETSIKGYITVIDYAKLGYQSVRVYFKFHNITPQEQDALEKDLITDSRVWWLVTLEGVWDVGYAVAVKSMIDFYEYWDTILTKYRKFILKKSVVVYSHIKQYPKSYLIEKKNLDEGFIVGASFQKCELDKLDLGLLKILSDNGRMPLLHIAQKLNTSPQVIKNHMNKLEKLNIILGYRALIDVTQFGYRYYKAYINFLHIDRLIEFHQYCKEHPNILNTNRTIGGRDFEIELQAKSFEEFDSVMKDLRTHFAGMIDEYEFVIARSEKKMVYYPF